MTMTTTARKARLLATTVAASLIVFSGAAHAQSAGALNGKYKKGTWALTKEAAVKEANTDIRTAAQKAADAASAARKTAAVALVPLGDPAVSTTVAYALASYTTAVEDADLAVTAEATATKNVATALALRDSTAAQAALILQAKQAADLKAANALAAYNTADSAYDDAVLAGGQTPTTAQQAAIDAALLAKTRAGIAKDLADDEAGALATAYGNSTTGAVKAAADASTDYQLKLGTEADKKADVIQKQSAVLLAQNSLNVKLADPTLAANLANLNAVEGTSFTASYESLLALQEYNVGVDVPVLKTLQASNGYARATANLAAAAASSNESIAMASGALSGSAAAVQAGANFETEVLGALVDHETRITTNTTAIAALDTRTTANTTAIAALDVRTTSNTTAIAALDTRTTANTTAIANEVTARVAADNALGARITAETDARIAADNALRDQIASSTATAIAMGGAALLPDMGFTLSGNIAVYEGAQAMALNAAAKVGANAYVTAAVGGGLNKNGSVGGRVGFVFGF